MRKQISALRAVCALFVAFTTSSAFAGPDIPTAPAPGIFALLALGVVGAIAVSRLRK